MITTKQRARLRSMANQMDTIFQIGKNGIGEETCRQVSAALDARELIKIRTLETSPVTSREAASLLLYQGYHSFQISSYMDASNCSNSAIASSRVGILPTMEFATGIPCS